MKASNIYLCFLWAIFHSEPISTLHSLLIASRDISMSGSRRIFDIFSVTKDRK